MRHIADGLADRFHRAACAAGRAASRLDRETLAMVADMALAYLGTPGALIWSQYLACRWRHRFVTPPGPRLRAGSAAPSQPGQPLNISTKGTGGDVNA
jgi:hypothetical protein